MLLPEMGVAAVFFFANADDAANLNDTPTAPAMLIMRIGQGNLLFTDGVETPADVLVELLSIDREQIRPFDGTAYPAARALIEEADGNGVVYALQLADNDWALVVMVAPVGDNIRLLDETLLMPVVRSLEVTRSATPEPTATLPPTRTPAPSDTPAPSPTRTLAPSPTRTPAPTDTPES
jgi:hypothetical protein